MKRPTYAPVYAAALYPGLAEVAKRYGYALAVHGSVQRDFDLIAIPWTPEATDPQVVVTAICGEFAITQLGNPTVKEHGRLAFTVSIGFGECFLDLSFMPRSGERSAV